MPAPNKPSDFWRHVDKTADCWVWQQSLGGRRYGRFRLRGKRFPAHHFAWALTHGPIPDGLHVLHRCDNPICVNPMHLFLGTHTDNMRDMFAKGRRRTLKGSGQANAKLTEQAAEEIRTRYAKGGVRQKDIADQYGIDQTTVSKIVRRQAWRHI